MFVQIYLGMIQIVQGVVDRLGELDIIGQGRYIWVFRRRFYLRIGIFEYLGRYFRLRKLYLGNKEDILGQRRYSGVFEEIFQV